MEIEKGNSLRKVWPTADMILMNPPFVPITELEDADQRRDVADILGDMNTGRVDISMAFVLKAVQSLRPGGVLGCVLPGSVLSGSSGSMWRERLQQDTDIILMGRFEGYHYFPTSLVETCFLVLRRKAASSQSPPGVQVVIAEEGAEESALRALRLPAKDLRRSTGGVEVFAVRRKNTSPDNWRPLRRSVYQWRQELLERGLPLIGSLFRIRQGIMTGDNAAFIISANEFGKIPKRERQYFRPAAGGKTIRQGQLLETEYVFYPYGPQGLLLTTQGELEREVPQYFKKYLQPSRPSLGNRSKIACWWGISRLCRWQFNKVPRLVSAFFGGSGSFAFNAKGEYAVVNGFGWDWQKPFVDGKQFWETGLPWAYLGLLNSTAFERILSWFSIPLQGGQFRLESKFLSRIPIPDLMDGEVESDLFEELVTLGQAVHRGNLQDVRDRLDTASAAAWGVRENLVTE